MANIKDIMLDVITNDLKIEGGDFVVADSTEQHQRCILMSAKGAYKQAPLLGVDLFNFLNDERPEDMMREIRIQFTNDGMKIKKMDVKFPSTINIDAPYE